MSSSRQNGDGKRHHGHDSYKKMAAVATDEESGNGVLMASYRDTMPGDVEESGCFCGGCYENVDVFAPEDHQRKNPIAKKRVCRVFDGLWDANRRPNLLVHFAFITSFTIWRTTFHHERVRAYFIHSWIIWLDCMLFAWGCRLWTVRAMFYGVVFGTMLAGFYSPRPYFWELLETTLMAVVASIYEVWHARFEEHEPMTTTRALLHQLCEGAHGVMYTSLAGLIVEEFIENFFLPIDGHH